MHFTQLSARHFQQLLLLIIAGVFIWSAIQPKNYFTWLLEVAPVLIGLPLVWVVRKSFPLSALVLALLTVHAVILMVGGHYTYAEVPWFNWLRDYFQLDRNYYDRVGHFAQGFVPAMVAREILIRKQVVQDKRWLLFLVTCICLSISACYELIEWWVAVLSGTQAEAFLGTQGDIWDTQWDMCLALIGALVAQISLAKYHHRSMSVLE
jgi:putative membrane protein